MLLNFVGNLKMKATIPCYTGGEKEAIIDECRPLLAKIVEVMGDVADTIRGKMKEDLISARRVTVTCDGWSSKNYNDSYMGKL